MAYTLKYQSSNGHTVVMHDNNTPKTGRAVGPVLSHQTGLTGVDIEFATAQGRIGEEVQGYKIRGKDIVISGNIIGESHQYALEILRAIIPGVPGRLVYNDAIYLDVEPKQTPSVDQFLYNAPFTLVLYAPYPYWKDMQETVIPMERVTKMFELPTEITEFQLGEVSYGAEGNVSNLGSVAVPIKAKMYFSGPVQSPYVLNQTTGERMGVEELFKDGESLEMDSTSINVVGMVESKFPDKALAIPNEGSRGNARVSKGGDLVLASISEASALQMMLYKHAEGFSALQQLNIGNTNPRTISFARNSPTFCDAYNGTGDLAGGYLQVYDYVDESVTLFGSAGSGSTRLVGVAAHPDGDEFFAITNLVSSGQAVTFYRNGSALASMQSTWANAVVCAYCEYHPSGNYLLALADKSLAPAAKSLGIVKRTARGNYTTLTSLVIDASGNPLDGRFSIDGTKVCLVSPQAPFVSASEFDAGGETLTSIPIDMQITGARKCCFLPNNDLVVAADNVLHFFRFDGSQYKHMGTGTVDGQIVSMDASPNADYIVYTTSSKIGALGYSRHEGQLLVDIDSTTVTLQPGQNYIEFNSDTGQDNIKGEVIARFEHVGAML